MLNNSFIIFILVAFFAPPLVGYFFYHKIHKTLGKGDRRKYNVKKIPPEFGRNEFINRVTMELCGVGGEGRLEIFSFEMVKALRAAHERGVKISFITGPVQICDNTRKAPLIELAKEGVINLFYSEKRQQEHFWVSERQVFYEEYHEPAAIERTAYYFRDNAFEAHYFMKKFWKAQKDAGPYDSEKSQFILMTQKEFDKAKLTVKCQHDKKSKDPVAFEHCSGSSLSEALKNSNISFLRA